MSAMLSSRRFYDALTFAAHAHRDQVRKGSGVPYLGHILGVASLVIDHGGTEDEAIAALLHDAIEDQGGDDMRHEIRTRYGEAVMEIVNGCTDTDITPKPPWHPRKEAFFVRLRTASTSVLLVCAADKLHNARSVLTDLRKSGDAVWDRFKGGKDGSLWYYRTAAEILSERLPCRITEELRAAVEAVEAEARA